MVKCCKCCRWDWLVRPTDTPDEARIKTLMFPFTLVMLAYIVISLIAVLETTGQNIIVVGAAITFLAMTLFMTGVLSNALPAGQLLDVWLMLCTIGICAQDLANATRSSGFRSWAFLVLLLDCALVFKRYHMPRILIPFVLVYNA
eukprot:Hpha_TRINITY_DN16088_c7_g11::TRINITY_DN16088_c7_g11_i1::g.121598::m.121598